MKGISLSTDTVDSSSSESVLGRGCGEGGWRVKEGERVLCGEVEGSCVGRRRVRVWEGG